MENITLIINSTLILLFLCISFSYSQERYDPQGIVHDQLVNIINVHYGSDYRYIGYTIFDSLIFHSNIENKRIMDPYKTLKGCILFSTYKDRGESLPDTFIVGMIKSGLIIWDNAPGTKADLGGDLLYAQDINKDGEVDLLISEKDRESSLMGKGPFLYYLYILSWNGIRGKFISAFDSNGCSAIMGDGDFELVDKDKNGICEITASLPDISMDWNEYKTSTFPHIIYDWNGSQYGFWRRMKQMDKPAEHRKKGP